MKRLLNGGDIMALGYPEGPVIGKILRAVEEAQLEGKISAKEEALEWVKQQAFNVKEVS